MRVAKSLRFLPGFAYDPVMGINHRIGDSRVAFHRADRQNGKSPIAGDVPQTVRKVPFALTTQACNPMGRHSFRNNRRHPQPLQEFQTIQKAAGTR
jgi:hypothetical protein